MEFLKEKTKTIAILKDNDILEIQTLFGNPIHIEVKCISGSLYVDEITVKRIKEIKTEQKQLENLKNFNQHKNIK